MRHRILRFLFTKLPIGSKENREQTRSLLAELKELKKESKEGRSRAEVRAIKQEVKGKMSAWEESRKAEGKKRGSE